MYNKYNIHEYVMWNAASVPLLQVVLLSQTDNNYCYYYYLW